MNDLIQNHFKLSSLQHLTPGDDMALNCPYVDPQTPFHNYNTANFAEIWSISELGKPKLFYIDPVEVFTPVTSMYRPIKGVRKDAPSSG